MNKELNVRLLSHPAITESGVYDAVFAVNGEVVGREFEVGVSTGYKYERETNSYHLKYVAVTAICCNEDDKDIADIMERKLEGAIENYMWGE